MIFHFFNETPLDIHGSNGTNGPNEFYSLSMGKHSDTVADIPEAVAHEFVSIINNGSLGVTAFIEIRPGDHPAFRVVVPKTPPPRPSAAPAPTTARA